MDANKGKNMGSPGSCPSCTWVFWTASFMPGGLNAADHGFVVGGDSEIPGNDTSSQSESILPSKIMSHLLFILVSPLYRGTSSTSRLSTLPSGPARPAIVLISPGIMSPSLPTHLTTAPAGNTFMPAGTAILFLLGSNVICISSPA